MDEGACAAGLAALAICESILLSLTENGIIDAAEAAAILEDAAAAHRMAESAPDGAIHKKAAGLIEVILRGTGSGQRT